MANLGAIGATSAGTRGGAAVLVDDGIPNPIPSVISVSSQLQLPTFQAVVPIPSTQDVFTVPKFKRIFKAKH